MTHSIAAPSLADFDRRSGNWLERLVFNNRLAVVAICAVVTVLLGFAAATRLAVNASFERMVPQKGWNLGGPA